MEPRQSPEPLRSPGRLLPSCRAEGASDGGSGFCTCRRGFVPRCSSEPDCSRCLRERNPTDVLIRYIIQFSWLL